MCIHSYCMKTKMKFSMKMNEIYSVDSKNQKALSKILHSMPLPKNLNCLKTSKAHNYETGLARLVWSHKSEQKLKQKSIKM